MPFVKLDCGIVDSSLWVDRDARDVFITALLMARPVTLDEPSPQLGVRDMLPTGWSAPAGSYGLVPCAGVGIVRASALSKEEGLAALERLGSPDEDSRSSDYDGRRLIRIDGGYLVLNYMRFREMDLGAAERMRVYRAKKRVGVTPNNDCVTPNAPVTGRNVTLALRKQKQKQKQKQEAETATTTTSPEVSPACDLVRVFNAVFERRVAVLPSIEAKAKKRLAAGVRPWQLAALPILVEAQGVSGGFRKQLTPEIMLRDGSHPRTDGSGRTCGATDWVERAFLRCDRTELSPRLVAIAETFGVLDKLKALGVTEAACAGE